MKKRKVILNKQLIGILIMIGLSLWAVDPLVVPLKAFVKIASSTYLHSDLVKRLAHQSGVPVEHKIAAPKTPQANEARRPRIVGVEPIPVSQNPEGIVILLVEIPRPDGQGFYTSQQWMRFMSHPVQVEIPEWFEPPR